MRLRIREGMTGLRAFVLVVAVGALACVPVLASDVGDTTTLGLVDGFAIGSAFGHGLAIALATLVSEDLACVAAGVAVANGIISLPLAVFASFLGIYVGDLMLFGAGRWLGGAALGRAPLRWFVSREDVERCSRWLERRGPLVIALSRLVPGTRLPTYFAAGALGTSFGSFAFYFLVAAAVWTPALVGLSALLGDGVLLPALSKGRDALTAAAVAAVAIYTVVRVTIRLATYKGRRLLVGAWRRVARWEFWPPWAFYPPVVAYIAFLAVKHRSATLFTAVNPAIADGGFVGESKYAILEGLEDAGEFVARAALLRASDSLDGRVERVRSFMSEHRLAFPVVLKPDVGQRGVGVLIARTDEQVAEYLRAAERDTIVQEYVPGVEFGVFYYRFPWTERGRIFSLTEKRFPEVVGDGRRTVEQLVMDDDRAVCMTRAYSSALGPRILDVPASGARVRLVEIGSHCRGAVFLDGSWALSSNLEDAIERVARVYDGFYFGRFDVRAASAEEFSRGVFKVVELNGVTAEATHIYDPRVRLLDAYRVVFEQWRIAFEIGASNRACGGRVTTLGRLACSIYEHFTGSNTQVRRSQ